MKLLSLLSGGIGSLVATKVMLDTYDVDELYCLFVNYGQKAFAPELFCAKKQAELLGARQFISINTAPLRGGTAVLNSGHTDDDCPECIPLLFEHLLTIATNYAMSWGCNAVCTGWEPYTYLPEMEEVSICLWEPLGGYTLQQIIKIGMDHGVSPFIHAWSCIAPQLAGRSTSQELTGLIYKPCGKCNKCLERRDAFKALDLEDPLKSLAME